MRIEDARRSYRRVVAVYDLIFGRSLSRGRREALRQLNDRGGQRILEIGIGTGLSLPLHRRDNHILGIDVSLDMLLRCQRRIASHRGPPTRLALMSAEALGVADHSCDAVLALYVMTVVENPVAVLRECARVLRPGGRLIIVSHLAAEPGSLLARLENLVAPLARVLGWDSRMSDSDLGLDRVPQLQLAARRQLGLFTLLELHRVPLPMAGDNAARDERVIAEAMSER